MMKLLCRIFGCPNSHYALIERVKSLDASIREDEARLSQRKQEILEIKSYLGLPTENKTSAAAQAVSWLTAAIFVFLLSTTMALIGVISADEVGDFLSYVLPALAAIVAGLGLFVGNDKRYYYTSCLLVVSGIATYITSKYDMTKLRYIGIIAFYALSVLVGMALLYFGKRSKEKSQQFYIRKQRIFFLLFILSLVDFAYIFFFRSSLVTITQREKTLTCEMIRATPGIKFPQKNLEFTCHEEHDRAHHDRNA